MAQEQQNKTQNPLQRLNLSICFYTIFAVLYIQAKMHYWSFPKIYPVFSTFYAFAIVKIHLEGPTLKVQIPTPIKLPS